MEAVDPLLESEPPKLDDKASISSAVAGGAVLRREPKGSVLNL